MIVDHARKISHLRYHLRPYLLHGQQHTHSDAALSGPPNRGTNNCYSVCTYVMMASLFDSQFKYHASSVAESAAQT